MSIDDPSLRSLTVYARSVPRAMGRCSKDKRDIYYRKAKEMVRVMPARAGASAHVRLRARAYVRTCVRE